MDVRHLRISGFKSFSDPVELAIDPGLTGIVGPNGCGKSNVVDALRWVMGESSAKGLRGAGMDDVIFNGSAFRPAFDFAEVSLKLSGPIEGLAGFETADEVEIVRRIGRGAGSAYRLNGKEARARDVQMLFADAAAGARSAAIVGQGQINLIVEAKPDERRRLLEEAAGIGGLHARRREAELRLASTGTNLERLADLLQIQRQRLGELERQAREALRYRRLAARLRALELLLARRRLSDIVAAIKELQLRAHALRSALGEAERRTSEASDARERANGQLTRAREQLTAAAAEAARLGERAEAQKAALAQIAAQRAELVQGLAMAEAEERAARARVPELEARRSEVADDLAALRRDLDAAQNRRQTEATALPGLLATLEQTRAALASARDDHTRAAASSRAAAADRDRVASSLSGLERSLAALPADLDAAPVTALRARIEALRQTLADSTSSAASLATELAAAEAALLELREALAAATQAASAAREAVIREEAERRAAATRVESAATRRRELQRVLVRLSERQASLDQRAAALDQRLAAADLKAAADRVAAAIDARAAAETRRQGLLVELEAAEAASTARRQATAEAAARLGQLTAEQSSLDALVPELPGQPLIDRLIMDESLGGALAAALGDDLLADSLGEAPTHWRLLEPASQPGPALPAGAMSLNGLVSGFPALAPRLSQLGLVDRTQGPALQSQLRQGQRLVSREGDLWRWDGFVRLASSGEAAARLAQRRRLAAVRREIPALQSAHAEAEAAEREADVLLLQLRNAMAEADKAGLAAERQETQARHEEATLQAQAAGMVEERQRVTAELAALAQERLEPDRALAGLPLEDAARAELASLAETAAGLEAKATELDRTAKALQGQVRQAEEAVRQLRGRQEQTARAAADHRARLEALTLDEARQTADLAARRQALAAERARLMRELAEAKTACEAAAKAHLSADALEAEGARCLQAAAEAEEAAAAAHQGCKDGLEALLRQLARDEERARALTQEEGRLGSDIEIARSQAAAAGARLEDRAKRLSALGPEPTAEPEILAQHRTAVAAETALGSEVRAIQEELERQAKAQTEGLALVAREREKLAVVEADLARETARREAAEAHKDEVEAAAQPEDAAALEGDDAEQGETVLAERLARVRAGRDRLGAVNLRAAVELEEMQTALERNEQEMNEVEGAVDRLKRAISTLNGEARARLLKAFTTVESHFQRLFQELFGGGKASLRLTNLDDPLNAGLELEAMPPGKRLTHVSLLSGGEKSMTGLALVFAFFLATPSPLCVLDEVDAPLDDANVDRFVLLTETIAKETGTRFLCITHHPLTMARMHRLYGVTMVERGVSRLVSVALDEAVELRQSAA